MMNEDLLDGFDIYYLLADFVCSEQFKNFDIIFLLAVIVGFRWMLELDAWSQTLVWKQRIASTHHYFFYPNQVVCEHTASEHTASEHTATTFKCPGCRCMHDVYEKRFFDLVHVCPECFDAMLLVRHEDFGTPVDALDDHTRSMIMYRRNANKQRTNRLRDAHEKMSDAEKKNTFHDCAAGEKWTCSIVALERRRTALKRFHELYKAEPKVYTSVIQKMCTARPVEIDAALAFIQRPRFLDIINDGGDAKVYAMFMILYMTNHSFITLIMKHKDH
jgi:hypothetical protein